MFSCSAGLFIGVNVYDNLPESLALRTAETDAAKMCSYFQAAQSTGRWKLFAESSDRLPNRADVLEAIHIWRSTIESGEAGVLYYAGHGVTCNDGLVLAARDFRPSMPFDSGVPLRRILEILSSPLSRASHYVLLLDACRTGNTEQLEHVPDNVSIIYSCPLGGEALERGPSGVFADLFLEAIAKCEVTIVDQARRMATLSSIVTAIERELVGATGAAFQRVDARVRPDVLLPLPDNTTAPGEPSGGDFPSSYIRTGELRASARDALYQVILDRLREWHGHDLSDLKGLVTGNEFDEPVGHDEAGILSLRLPQRTEIRPSHAFLVYILDQCRSRFDALQMEWAGAVNTSCFRQVAVKLGLQYEVRDECQSLLVWPNGGLRGQAWIWTSANAATVGIGCRTNDGIRVSLEMLMPSLQEVYDCLCEIRTTEH